MRKTSDKLQFRDLLQNTYLLTLSKSSKPRKYEKMSQSERKLRRHDAYLPEWAPGTEKRHYVKTKGI